MRAPHQLAALLAFGVLLAGCGASSSSTARTDTQTNQSSTAASSPVTTTQTQAAPSPPQVPHSYHDAGTGWRHLSRAAKFRIAASWIYDNGSGDVGSLPITTAQLVQGTDEYMAHPNVYGANTDDPAIYASSTNADNANSDSDSQPPDGSQTLEPDDSLDAIMAAVNQVLSDESQKELQSENNLLASNLETKDMTGQTMRHVQALIGAPDHTQRIDGQVLWYYYTATNVYQLVFAGSVVSAENKY